MIIKFILLEHIARQSILATKDRKKVYIQIQDIVI